jgi:hypothetical protein
MQVLRMSTSRTTDEITWPFWQHLLSSLLNVSTLLPLPPPLLLLLLLVVVVVVVLVLLLLLIVLLLLLLVLLPQ